MLPRGQWVRCMPHPSQTSPDMTHLTKSANHLASTRQLVCEMVQEFLTGNAALCYFSVKDIHVASRERRLHLLR